MATKARRAPLVDPLADIFAAVEAEEAVSTITTPRDSASDIEIPAASLMPHPTIWAKIRDQVKRVEVDAVKRALGSTLVDNNEALYSEAEAFVQILADFQKRSASIRRKLESRPKLAPTPAQEMLATQIKLLLGSFRPKTRDGRPALETDKDRAVYEYVSGSAEPGTPRSSLTPRSSRPSSSRSLLRGVRPSTAESLRGTGSIRSAPEQRSLDKVSVFNIDSVVSSIREAIEEEKDVLMEHIVFLQECLEDENDAVVSAQDEAAEPAAPGVAELREFEAKLQAQILDQERTSRTLDVLERQPLSRSNSDLLKRPVLGSVVDKSRVLSSTSDTKPKHRTPPRKELRMPLGSKSPMPPDRNSKRSGRARPAGAFSPEARRGLEGPAAPTTVLSKPPLASNKLPPPQPRRSRSRRLRDEVLGAR